MELTYTMQRIFELAYSANSTETDYLLTKLVSESRSSLAVMEDDEKKYRRNYHDDAAGHLTDRIFETRKYIAQLESLLSTLRLR